jgi:hypothetical protein
MFSQKTSTILALVLSLTAGGAAWADPSCHAIHGSVSLGPAEGPCDSAIALCATGELRGVLRGNSEFTGTGIAPNVDTAATSVVTLTGDNVIHLKDGDLFTKDAIVLATAGNGEFGEVDSIVGGTGAYDGASGRFVATGVFAAGSGEGVYHGELCLP